MIKTLLITIILVGLVSCSDNSTGPGETDVDSGEGAISVTGALQAQHEGAAWYVGLRSDNDNFINLTVSLSDRLPDESGDSLFGFTIRFVGAEGPFPLSAGTYENGIGSDEIMVSVTYAQYPEDDTIIYSTSHNSTGTVTILSVSDSAIEVAFDVELHAGQGSEGTVTITGEINADCLTAGTGFGC